MTVLGGLTSPVKAGGSVATSALTGVGEFRALLSEFKQGWAEIESSERLTRNIAQHGASSLEIPVGGIPTALGVSPMKQYQQRNNHPHAAGDLEHKYDLFVPARSVTTSPLHFDMPRCVCGGMISASDTMCRVCSYQSQPQARASPAKPISPPRTIPLIHQHGCTCHAGQSTDIRAQVHHSPGCALCSHTNTAGLSSPKHSHSVATQSQPLNLERSPIVQQQRAPTSPRAEHKDKQTSVYEQLRPLSSSPQAPHAESDHQEKPILEPHSVSPPTSSRHVHQSAKNSPYVQHQQPLQQSSLQPPSHLGSAFFQRNSSGPLPSATASLPQRAHAPHDAGCERDQCASECSGESAPEFDEAGEG